MWIILIIVLAVVVYFLVSQASSSNQANNRPSRSYVNQVDYSNIQISLDSDVPYVDYTHLRDLLAEGKWKEADEETGKMMLTVANITLERAVGYEKYQQDYSDIHRFSPSLAPWLPCTDLCTIDRLWLKYSNGRFGFSIQKRILSELGEDALSFLMGTIDRKKNYYQELQKTGELKARFTSHIGWYAPPSEASSCTKTYNNLTFAIEAPYGHLPTANYYREGYGGLWETKPLNYDIVLYVLDKLSNCGIAL